MSTCRHKLLGILKEQVSRPLPSYPSRELCTFRFKITFTSCFRMDNAQGQGIFPKWGAKLNDRRTISCKVRYFGNPPTLGLYLTLFYPKVGSNFTFDPTFWKFYLIGTSFTLGELVSLVKVFRLFRLKQIFLVFRPWTQ
jgi:hypothetical protein